MGGRVVDLAVESRRRAARGQSRPATAGLQLLDARTLEPLDFADDIPASGIAFSPDSTQLAMAVNQWNGDDPPRIDDQPLRLYDMPGGTLADRQLGGFPESSAVEYALDFSADGRRLAAAVLPYDAARGEFDSEDVVMVWDLARPERPVVRGEAAQRPAPGAQPRRAAALRRADR